MPLVDLYDYYLDSQGRLNRWLRGSTGGGNDPTAPGAPTNAQATLSGTTAAITWVLPTSDGGSPLTAVTVTREGGATHTLAATATSDTFTGATAGDAFDVAAVNAVGAGPIAVARTAATTYRFPGDTLPLLTGQVLTGATEEDQDGTRVRAGGEFVAPEAVTGLKYGVIKVFYHGSGVLSAFTPSTGAMAQDIKKHYSMGHILLLNVAIQQSGQTWRQAADGRNNATFDGFIRWCEEGSDAPNCPMWLCMPHEPSGPGPYADPQGGNHKYSVDPTVGMLPGDYADLQVAFRARMDAYALSKVGGSDPTAYKWKRLAFGGILTGDQFSVASTSNKYIGKFYTSYQTGLPIAKRTWDFAGSDPYQNPISGTVTPGRTGFPMWNTYSKDMVAWCKAKGYPVVFGEFGIHNTDADAAFQLQDFWNHVTDGTNDVVAIIYWNDAPNGPFTDPSTSDVGRFLFVDDDRGGGLIIPNGGLASKWYQIMRDPKSVRFWDVGYSKPPGV